LTIYGKLTDKALKEVYETTKSKEPKDPKYKIKNEEQRKQKEKKNHDKKMEDDIDPSEMLAYTVPVTMTKAGKFCVNWSLIDKLIEYIKNRLYEIALPTDRHLVVAKYDLEELAKNNRVRE
jgi:hypothetical protein